MPRAPRLLGVVLLSLLVAPPPARAGDLTLRDLIELHRAGLGEEVLIAVVEVDGGPFTLSYAEIVDLKTEGLGERVIAALVRTGRPAATLSGATAPPEETGAVAPAAVEREGTHVEPSVVVVETVVPYLVPYVVPYVVTSPRGGRRDDDRRGDDARRGHGDRHDRRQTPPATWVTRAEDGRNIALTPRGRPVRSDAPRATWVTPNEISTRSPGAQGRGDRPGRDGDRQDRRGNQRDEDRSPTKPS